MSIQTTDIAASLQRASLVQQVQSAQQDAESVAGKQSAADIAELARAAEEEVGTTAPAAGKRVHDRDAGQGADYRPPRRQRKPEPPAPPPAKNDQSKPNPPGEGTIIDIEA